MGWCKRPKSRYIECLGQAAWQRPTIAVSGRRRMPRYVQLAELIRQRVVEGHWPPGSLLPSIEHGMSGFAGACHGVPCDPIAGR